MFHDIDVEPATSRKKPLVMSGVRLNISSLRNDTAVDEKFGVTPPPYPLLELPLSTFFDLLVIGFTVPVALFND